MGESWKGRGGAALKACDRAHPHLPTCSIRRNASQAGELVVPFFNQLLEQCLPSNTSTTSLKLRVGTGPGCSMYSYSKGIWVCVSVVGQWEQARHTTTTSLKLWVGSAGAVCCVVVG